MYSKENYTTNNSKHSPRYTWLTFVFIFIVCSSLMSNTNAQKTIGSLNRISNNSPADTLIIVELSKIANEMMVEKPNEAVKLVFEAIELSNRTGYNKGLIYNYKLLGNIYYRLQDYEKSITNYEICLEHLLKVSDYRTAMSCYLNIGAIFFTHGMNSRALDYYLMSLEYAQSNTKEKIYNNIGLIYLKEKKLDEALSYFTKSLEIKESNNKQLGIAISYNNIGEVYMKMGKPNIAKVYFQKSYNISKIIDDREGIVFSLNNFGEISKSENNLDSTITFFKNALRISKEINNQMLIAQSLYNIGHTYFFNNQYTMAKGYLLESYKISKDLEVLPEIEKSSHLLALIYQEAQDFKSSYSFLNINKIVSDSLSRNESAKQLLKLSLDYKFKLKDEESKRLLELKQHEYKKAKFKLTTIIFVLITLLLLAIFIFIRIKQQMRISKIEREKIVIKKQSLEKELEFKNKEIIEKVLKIIEKNELIELTVKRLYEFSLSLPQKKRAEVNLINKELKSKEMKNQWTEFHHYFTMIYSKFFENLEKDYPELTTNEKRLCAYLKLNMSTKDIATLTFQNFKSIEVARTRLRKRFDLTNKNISYQEFFSHYN